MREVTLIKAAFSVFFVVSTSSHFLWSVFASVRGIGVSEIGKFAVFEAIVSDAFIMSRSDGLLKK